MLRLILSAANKCFFNAHARHHPVFIWPLRISFLRFMKNSARAPDDSYLNEFRMTGTTASARSHVLLNLLASLYDGKKSIRKKRHVENNGSLPTSTRVILSR